MKHRFCTALVLLVVLATIFTGTAFAADYGKTTIKIGMAGTEHGVDYIAALHFKELVEKATDGKIKVQVFPNNILSGGNQAESINLLTQGGAMDMGIFSAAVFSNLNSAFQVCMLPFIFKDYAEVNARLDGGGNEYITDMLKNYGLVNLGAMHYGIKQWTNNKSEKRTPADFTHFKMRIPGGEVSVMTWKAFGADPISMSWSEVYTALQQGIVDGYEGSYQGAYSANIHEIQKYFTEANYIYDGYWLVANKKSWDKYTPDLQALLTKLGDEAVRYGRKYLEDDEIRIKQELIERGNIITELTPEERQAFVDATESVRAYFLEKFGKEAFDAWGIKY